MYFMKVMKIIFQMSIASVVLFLFVSLDVHSTVASLSSFFFQKFCIQTRKSKRILFDLTKCLSFIKVNFQFGNSGMNSEFLNKKEAKLASLNHIIKNPICMACVIKASINVAYNKLFSMNMRY